MTMIYLAQSTPIDNIAYPAPCLINIDRMTATSLVGSGAAVYATPAIQAACGGIAFWDHERTVDGRHVSGRTGSGVTESPTTCFAAHNKLRARRYWAM